MNKRNRNALLGKINGRRPSSKPYTGELEKAAKGLCEQVEKLLDERRALRLVIARSVRGMDPHISRMDDIVEGLNPKAAAELDRLLSAASND